MKNIIFLLADDQRFDTIGALGNQEIHTPNLDRLAARGSAFTEAFIPGGTSGAVCMPSRAMIHTGQFLTELTDCGAVVPPEHALLGEQLRQSGYQTSGIGKWHNGTDSYRRSFSRGGEIFFGGMWDHWNVPVNEFAPDGCYEQLRTFTQDPFSSKRTIELPAEKITLGKHSTDLFADKIIEEIRELAQAEQPFFIYGSFLAPHDPRTMPPAFQDMYQPDSLTIPANYLPEHPFGFDIQGERDETLEAYPRQPEAVRQHLADYYAMISHLDARIGDIVAALGEAGVLEETLIVFSGDNGLALGQHGLMGKQNLYDCSIRVPLLLAGPGIPQNQLISEKVLLLDLLPTLLAYAGAEIPDLPLAQNLLPLLQQEQEATGRQELYLLFTSKIRGLLTPEFKLLEYRTKDGSQTQLFDRQKDPHEQVDLASDPAYRQQLADLRKRLKELAQEMGDRDFEQGQIYWERYEQELLK